MKEPINEIKTVTKPFSLLLDNIADTSIDVMLPDGFANGSRETYKTVVQDLQQYLFEDGLYMLNRYFEARDKLQELLNQAEGFAVQFSKVTGKPDVHPIRSGLALYVCDQLTALIEFIQPDNLIKP